MTALKSGDRIDLRIRKDLKVKLDRAASILGQNRTDYVVRVMEENANKVLENYSSMTLSNDIFDGFVEACAKADQPNESLRAAKRQYDEMGME